MRAVEAAAEVGAAAEAEVKEGTGGTECHFFFLFHVFCMFFCVG